MKLKTILIILISVGALISCDEAFLDQYPKDELSAGSFWKSEQDAEMFVNDIYNALPMFLIDDDVNSDNALHGIKWAEGDIAKGIYDPMNTTFAGHWEDNYETIRKSNVLLENIVNIADIDATARERIIAQALFFRAYAHFELAKIFGDIPLVDRTLSLDESYTMVRDPLSQVVDFIVKDLSDAANALPIEWEAAEYGRITKGAALAFKARVELFFHRFADAEASAKAVMDLNHYDLYRGNYVELFYTSYNGDDRKIEMVLETHHKRDDRSSWYNTWSAPPGFGWGGINPTQSFVDEFECTDGLTIDESDLYDDANPFESRDPRLEVNVLHHGEVFNGKEWHTRPVPEDYPTGIATYRDATSTGYYQQKFFDPNDDFWGSDWFNSSHDWPVIRYAEVLLSYAEARIEQSKIDATTFDAIDEVRGRVNMPPVDRGRYGSQAALRQLIRREWRAEFGMEGRRWLDIRRWDIGGEVLNGQFYGMKYNSETQEAFVGEPVAAGVPRQYQSHNRLWPIPQGERDLNPNLTQNPGYSQ